MSLHLYHSPYSTCSQKVRLCLAEKQLEFERHDIDLAKQDHLTEEYLEMNPNGVVPTLVHDEAVVIDSSVICEYLDEVFADPPLGPREAIGRARMRAWMRYSEEVPTTAIRAPSFNQVFAPLIASMKHVSMDELADKLPLRKEFYKKMRGADGFDEATVLESTDRLKACLERMEQQLSNSAWLVGEEFSIADIVIIPTIVRMVDLGMTKMWEDMPHVTDWLARVEARESFDKAYYPGTRIDIETFGIEGAA